MSVKGWDLNHQVFSNGGDKLASLRFQVGNIVRCGDGDYDRRNRLVLLALVEAQKVGVPAGVRFDASEPEWPVVFIELPTGQVSWHVAQHAQEWDRHDTAVKWLRCAQFLAGTTTLDIHVK